MRKLFAEILYDKMQADERIFFITADLGYRIFDKIRKDFPDRSFNTGAAEQATMGIGVGLALSGKIPVVYSITPFLLWRAAETIRNYINHERIPVKLIGSGRNDDYKHDGFSHDASDDAKLMTLFENINCAWPYDGVTLHDFTDKMFSTQEPFYLNLQR